MAAVKPTRPAPPKPAPKPGHVKVVRAMHKYDAQYDDELSFEEGEILYILDMSNKDWWNAKCGNKTGLIPCNYVDENTESVENPLHEAAKRGNLGFMKECLLNNVSVNSLDKSGATPLHWAAHAGHLNCLTTLLAQPRCEVNVQNKLGDTALHNSAWKGHANVVQVLLEQGVRTDLYNREKKTAYDLARDPQTAALLQHATQQSRYTDDYGAEDDSD